MDVASRQLVTTLAYGIFQIPSSLFLLAIIVPLYKVAADRTALYILFSKSCFNIANQLTLAIYTPMSIYAKDVFGEVKHLYPAFGQCLYQIIYVHIFALGFNRFIAVFFMFKYNKLFTKSRTFLYILFIWIWGIILGVLVVLQGSSGNLNSIIQSTVLIASGAIYGAMLLNFGWGMVFKSANEGINGGMEKDRILLCCICFLSLLPLLFAQGIRQGLLLNAIGSPIWMFFSIAQIVNVTAVQFVEECCLIIFCKDFRVQLKKQFSFFSRQTSQTPAAVANVVTKISVSSVQHVLNVNNEQPLRIRTITV